MKRSHGDKKPGILEFYFYERASGYGKTLKEKTSFSPF